jgi:hypothetical protein
MAWPPVSNITANFYGKVSNLPTTVAWGTEGLYSGVIVKSLRSSRMIEEIKIDNGTGLTTTQILLNDGDEVEITVVDDRNVNFPDSGNVITLLNPLPNGAGATSENFQVVNNNYNAARKTDGERTLLVKKYSLLTPTAM